MAEKRRPAGAARRDLTSGRAICDGRPVPSTGHGISRLLRAYDLRSSGGKGIYFTYPFILPAIERPARTPLAEACRSPLVIPAPSPMEKRLATSVSISEVTLILLQ